MRARAKKRARKIKTRRRVMEEVREIEPKAKRPRKPNFSASEVAVLTENVIGNIDILQAKLTNTVTNKRKHDLWEDITKTVNAIGSAKRSVQEVRDKWRNLQSTAKKEFVEFKKTARKTGGGPAPKPPTLSSQVIIDVFEDKPSFSGLHGFEAGVELEASTSTLPCIEVDNAELMTAIPVIEPNSPTGFAARGVFGEALGKSGSGTKRKITREDVLKEQYEVLIAQQENLALKKKKLQLEVCLLEHQVRERSLIAPLMLP